LHAVLRDDRRLNHQDSRRLHTQSILHCIRRTLKRPWILRSVIPYAETGNFSLHHRLQTGSSAHPASYLIGIRGSFAGGKAAGA
jgi:hypothetical protein